MIDETKYEGHTPGPWWFVEDYAEHDDPTFLIRANENEQLVYHQTGEWLPDKRVDWRLMADAPKLLAEVKRLREAMKTMLDGMKGSILMHSINDASPEEDIEYWLDAWKHWLSEMSNEG